jgi:hypothetical protein
VAEDNANEGGGMITKFHLNRVEDESGISGTGRVAEGVIFSNGWCSLVWLTAHTSCAFYTSIDEVRAIHGHGGKTEIVFELSTRDLMRSLDLAMEIAKSKVIDDWAWSGMDEAHRQLKAAIEGRAE